MITPDAETVALYEMMTTPQLLQVGAAYRLDLERLGLPDVARHFAEGRLALVARILADRGNPQRPA